MSVEHTDRVLRLDDWGRRVAAAAIAEWQRRGRPDWQPFLDRQAEAEAEEKKKRKRPGGFRRGGRHVRW